jgi:secondary thiamine-phosphate synthase enzyme
MPVITQHFTLAMQGHTHMENVTGTISDFLQQSGLTAGIVTVFVRHTTAAVLIIEDEPGLRADTRDSWNQLIPPHKDWQHNTRNPGEDNGHSHLRGQIQGQSLTVPFSGKALLLGTWQQIAIIDFDTRARPRDVIVQITGE